MPGTNPIIARLFIMIVVFTLTFVSAATADVEQVPEELSPAFEHLLSFTNQSGDTVPKAERVNQVIDFVNSAKSLNRTFSMGVRKGAASNYSEFYLNRSLKEVLDLVYNPHIPSYITTPASVRRSKWVQVKGKTQGLPKLSDYLVDLTGPTLIKGIEFVENTPDAFSGAYYAYELNRALMLTRHHGHPVLISISRQRSKSDVGKKGLVLGDDDNWDYLYTGEKGCTLPGLGWVKSYMYDSASITVYYEEGGSKPKVRCGVFKWIRAGWAGMNMVQPHHIREGVQRFAKNYKNILESPSLADTARLSRAFQRIGSMPEKELRQKVQCYYLNLKEIYQSKSRLASRWFKRLSGSDGYLAKMKPEEMKAILDKAYVKHLLGKNPGVDLSLFDPLAAQAKYPG